MTPDYIKDLSKQLYAIGAAILDKTGEKPWVAPKIEIENDYCRIILRRDYANGITDIIGTAKGDTPDEAIAAAWAILATLPDLATSKLRDHMCRVAEIADKARSDGIDDAYIAPLSVVVQAISNNMLEGPKP